MANQTGEQVQIEYPCAWLFKIIGLDRAGIEAGAHAVLDGREHLLTPSRQSRSGRYVSLNLELVVTGPEDRDRIYAALKEQPAVRMVL